MRAIGVTRSITWRGLEIQVTWKADLDTGRAEPMGVAVSSDRPLSSAQLRSLPWARIFSSAPPERIFDLVVVDKGKKTVQTFPQFEPSLTGRPRRYEVEHFAEVARVYEDAFINHRTPTRAVAKHFKTTESAAAKWVAKCRELGMLPSTTRGKARVTPKKRGRK